MADSYRFEGTFTFTIEVDDDTEIRERALHNQSTAMASGSSSEDEIANVKREISDSDTRVALTILLAEAISALMAEIEIPGASIIQRGSGFRPAAA